MQTRVMQFTVFALVECNALPLKYPLSMEDPLALGYARAFHPTLTFHLFGCCLGGKREGGEQNGERDTGSEGFHVGTPLLY